MNSILLEIIYCFVVLVIVNGAAIDSIPNPQLAKIYKLWKNQEKYFQLDNEKDAVLFLGNVRSKKTAAVKIIAGTDFDVHKETKQHEKFPRLLTDESGIAYYDCPGFTNRRSPSDDLTIAYFLNKLTTHADAFKFVFVTSHASVETSKNPDSFMALVRNSTMLIKDIEKYSDGMALIVTADESSINDDTIVNNIANFLKELKKTLHDDNNGPNLSDEKRKVNSDSIKLIEAFLYQEGNSYPRIGILRRNKNIDQKILQAERNHLRTMINEKLSYVRKENDDFGFINSLESPNYTVELTRKINEVGFVSDMTNIGREIKEFYLNKEHHTSDLTELYNKSKLGVESISAIRTNDPRLTLKDILNTAHAMDLVLSSDTIECIVMHLESVDFLTKVVDQTLPNHLVQKVNGITKYLKKFSNWYNFLIDLQKELTNIEFQNDDMKNIARNTLKYLVKISADKTSIKMNDIGLKSLLATSKNKKLHSYIDFKFNIETPNLNELKNILNEFLSDKLITTCTQNELKEFNMEVRGHVIKMSDVVNDACYASAKNIKIFALNKLIVDENVNKTGQQAQIVIIAPTWEIIEQKSFILDGENGKNHTQAYAENGRGEKDRPCNGKPGEPGLPGKAGGNFFGIGSTFLHGDHLTIQLNGGKGGAGQHGGNGSIGIEGDTPPVLKGRIEDCAGGLTTLWDDESFKYEDILGFLFVVYGKNGTKPGVGGDGGKHGNAGLAGKIMLFELDQAANVKILNENGAVGAIGKGGHGGNGTKNGKTLHITMSIGHTYLTCIIDVEKTIDGSIIDAGKNGLDNKNTQGMQDAVPSHESDHPIFAVNEYKSFAREYSIGSSRQTEINKFLNKMTNNETLKAQYGPLDLINEFITMEDQYFKMRRKIDFVPLLSRTEEFARTNKFSADQKRALAYLYTAILSKIYGINNKVYENTVFDLDVFLKSVEKNIKKLSDLTAEINRNDVRNNFHSLLDEKVRSANDFIANEIKPEINRIYKKIDEDVEKLIDESVEKQNTVTESIKEQKRRQRELRAKIILQQFLGGINIFGAVTCLFGPAGAAVGTAINTGTSLIEAFGANDGSDTAKAVSAVSATFKANMTYLGEALKKRPEFIQQKIKDIDEYVKKHLADDEDAGTTSTKVSGKEIQKLKDQIKTSKSEIDGLNKELTERIKKGDFNIPRDLMQRCDEVEKKVGEKAKEAKEKLENRKNQLTNKNEKEKKKLDKRLRKISHVQNLANIAGVTAQTYYKIRNDETKLKVVSDTIESLQNDLTALRYHEAKIYEVLIPQIDAIQNNLNEMSKNLKGNAHVELDVKKWKIRNTLSEVRQLFNQMTTEFSVHDSMGSSIQKLDEGMATLIDVYDRIDSYSDTQKLTTYIEHIVSDKSPIGDTELSDAVSKVKQLIQSNIVLEEYEMAMHVFKQHYFPIANILMSSYLHELPESLQMNDTAAIVQKSIDKVGKIMDKIELSRAVQNTYGSTMDPKAVFDGNDGSQPPFYIWKYREYKDQIKDLLNGKAITIKADVTRGVNQNAIKFSKIGIRFKSLDPAVQEKLDKKLLNFRVNMTMVGTNYYRCNNRYYQISLDRNVDIVFKFKKGANEIPNDPNEIYNQIAENKPFLSPYVMWTINLTGDLRGLISFTNQILDLELIGSGEYLEHGPFSNGICAERLDEYYNFDKTISNVNALMLSKGL